MPVPSFEKKPIPPKPVPKPEVKKGLFGPGGFRTFQETSRFLKKPDVAPPSGYEQKWTKSRREILDKDIQKFSKLIGKTGGVTESDVPWIVKKMQDSKASAPWPEKKKIDENIKMLEHYRKGGK